MEWTELILNFVGQIAWPLVVLFLGLRFRKPLLEVLKDTSIKMLTAGPTGLSIEREVQKDLGKAAGRLLAAESPSAAGAEGPPEVSEAQPEHSSDRATNSPSDNVLRPAKRPRLASNGNAGESQRDPVTSILQSTDMLRTVLQKLLEQVIEVPEREHQWNNLDWVIDQAGRYGLLTSSELTSAEELTDALNLITSTRDTSSISMFTAATVAYLCLQLRVSAELAAQEMGIDINRR